MNVRRLYTENVSNSTHLMSFFLLVKKGTLHILRNTSDVELINGCPFPVRASWKEDYISSSHIHTNLFKIQFNIILSFCLDSGV